MKGHNRWIILLILVLIAAFICYVIRRSWAEKASFEAELAKKTKQLNELMSRLTEAMDRKAFLDKKATRNASVISFTLLSACLILSLISGFCQHDATVNLYAAFKDALEYLSAIIGLALFNKVFSLDTIHDWIKSRMIRWEYKRHAFEPSCIPILIGEVEILNREIQELKAGNYERDRLK
jgi:flagellar biosynthesis protein FlhB